MKKIKKENGWDEITTKRIRFTGFMSKYFMPCISWKNHNGKRKRGMIHCQYCGKKWDDCDDYYWTSLVQTSKGNKVLCVDCFDGFSLTNTGPSKEKREQEFKEIAERG